MFKDIKEDNYFNGETVNFPLFAAEAGQINALIAEEAITQRYRLSNTLSYFRLIFLSLSLLFFLFLYRHESLRIYIISTILVYSVLVIFYMFRAKRHKDEIFYYNFVVTVAEISLFFFLSFHIDMQLFFGLVFLSVVVSSMCLPISRLLVVLLYAISVLTFSWFNLHGSLINGIVNNSIIDSLREKFTIPSDIEWLFVVLIGLVIFAVITNQLATWSFKNDVKARFRYNQMRQVLSFNRAVIEHLKTGVIVSSGNGKILSINRRAIDLLNLDSSRLIIDLSTLSIDLSNRLNHWLSSRITNQEPYLHNADAKEVFLSYDCFGEYKQHNIVMITLESVNETTERAQNAKLSALGRLTAGVAHEIRNPLASISSATQLLSESSESIVHQNLSQVIIKNVKRTNQIISDILGLFNESKSKRELLSIEKTLEGTISEFLHSKTGQSVKINLQAESDEHAFFYFAKGQFEQILYNLFHNAVKYSQAEELVITVIFGLSKSRQIIYIDVIDNGNGIEKSQRGQIFEPFFTQGEGSGLGLYLARELCSANSANIVYLPLSDNHNDYTFNSEALIGARFRIVTKAYFTQKLKKK